MNEFTRRPFRKAAVSIVIALALLSAPPAIAQSVPPLSAFRPPEWGAAAGYGFSVHLNHGHSDEHVLLIEPSVGFRLSSRIEYVVEAHFARYFTPGGYMLGVMPVGGRLYLGHGRTLPYFSIGGGLGWTDLTVEEIDRRFNFLLQASAAPAGDRRSHVGSTPRSHLQRGNEEAQSGPELPRVPRRLAFSLAARPSGPPCSRRPARTIVRS